MFVRRSPAGSLAAAVRSALVVGLLGAGLSTPLMMLSASGAAAASVPAGEAYVRTAHLSPDTPGVDIYLSAGKARPVVIRNATYGHFSPYLELAAGSYAVSTRLAGSAASSASLVSWKMTLGSGKAYTAAILGSGASRRGTVLQDDLTPPAAGKARVRLIQAASNAPVANVTANGNVPVADGARYASATGYVSLPAGTWPLTAQSTGSDPVKVAANISLASGSVTSVVLLNKVHGGITLISALDSAGAGVVPVSGINTGGGGLARSTSSASATGPLEVTAGLAVLATGLTLLRRRRATWS